MIKLHDRALSKSALNDLADYQAIIQAEPTYEQQRKKAQALWKSKKKPRKNPFLEVTNVLIAMSPATRRCSYCEDARGEDIDHFRPKNLYPELTFEWANYLLACSACNSNAKRDKFAIFDANNNSQTVTKDNRFQIDPFIKADSALINPRYEDPLEFLRIDILNSFYFQARPHLSERDKQRADYTIDTLQLNKRTELVDWRTLGYSAFVGWVDTYRRYKKVSPSLLADHRQKLKKYNHLAVWEEMKRVYRERDLSRWEQLKERNERLAELDEFFTEHPELLNL